MEKSNKSLDSVPGFTCIGKNSGIKKRKKDLAILYSETICNTAAMYTKNRVKGAPLVVTKEHLADGKAQALVVNSGLANVGTGPQGMKDAKEIAALTAKELGIKQADVLVSSTGVIGKRLPMDKIAAGISGSKKDLMMNSSGDDFANAIMTTDTIDKQVSITTDSFTIAGCAKGSGMIHPNMATMLAFIVTDAKIESQDLETMLKSSVESSFNMVNIDLDTSTSDMVIVMANGLSGNIETKAFAEALDQMCLELAQMIASDGEGATKLIISEVVNGKNKDDAREIAKIIVNSTLVKCAIFGNDPNWGRILGAIGNTSAEFDQDKLSISINDNTIFKNSIEVIDFNKHKLSKSMKDNKETRITINLNIGDSSATAYGCDMSYDYVRINAEYTT